MIKFVSVWRISTNTSIDATFYTTLQAMGMEQGVGTRCFIQAPCVNEPTSALKAHRASDVLSTPHGAREGTTSRRATLVTAAPNVEHLVQWRRASWRPCRACGSTHVTRRPPSLLEQRQEVLCLRLLPLLGAERRPPVIHRNSGDPISFCTLFNA